MVIVFVDLTGSTQAIAEQGEPAIASVRARLAAIRAGLMIGDPRLRQIGPAAGDGCLLVGHDVAGLVRAALEEQARWRGLEEGLPARLAIGVGEPSWSGPESDSMSTPYGSTVNLTSRLLSVCPPGGIGLAEGAHLALLEASAEGSALGQRFQAAKGPLRGFQEPQRYWLWAPPGGRAERVDGETGERLARLEARMDMMLHGLDEVRGDVRESRSVLDQMAAGALIGRLAVLSLAVAISTLISLALRLWR